MKLKQKLAQDFLIPIHWNEKMDGVWLDELEIIYLAGFEKGLAMTIEAIAKGEKCAPMDIAFIGEEEVEDGSV